MFGHAMQTGQLGPVLQQFGLGEETTAAAANGGTIQFFRSSSLDNTYPRSIMVPLE